MTYRVRFTLEASDDLERLYDFIVSRDDSDVSLAERALAAIASGIATLESSPFTCRKARLDAPLLRELVIPFGSSGYVALFEVEEAQTVTVLAVRHQREDDYY